MSDPIADAVHAHEVQYHGVVDPPPPDPEPTPDPGTDPWSLKLMPVKAGWKRLAYTNFREDGNRALGQGFGPHLASLWKPREGMKDSSQRGTYSAKDTWSQKDGIGDVYLHSHKLGADPLKHDPAGTIHKVFGAVSMFGDHPEQLVQWTEQCPTTPGRKQAPLFWAFGTNDNGEDDHYEHKYGTGQRSNSFHHYYGGGGQEAIRLNVVTTDPHALGMYFRAKGTRGSSDPGEFSTYVDGQLRKTFTTKQTPNPMHFVMQIETYLKADPLPSSASDGHVRFTQYALDVPA